MSSQKVTAEARRKANLAAAAGSRVSLPAAVRRGMPPISVVDPLKRILAAIRRSGYLTVDVETTGYPLGHPEYALRSIQMGDMHESVVLDPADENTAQIVSQAVLSAPEVVTHSATADIAPLAYAGFVDYALTMTKVTDTAVLAKLADPSSTGGSPGLKEAAPAVLKENAVVPAADKARKALFTAGKWLTNVTPGTPVERSGWAQSDPRCETMITYAASDVLDCAALRMVLPKPDRAVEARERAVEAVTATVAYKGISLDAEAVRKQIKAKEPRVAELDQQLRDYWRLDNPNSPVQVRAAFMALSVPLGDTRKETLASVASTTSSTEVRDFAEQLLEYRQQQKLLTSFLRPWQELALHGDGLLRPTIYTLGADTGRMSCVRPNLQQVPREGGMRECIVARSGHALIAADFSSVEIRVAAALSQDPNLISMLQQGVDIHLLIAREIWGAHVTKHSAERTLVKRIVFGWLYGGGFKTLAFQSGITEDQARRIISVLNAMVSKLTTWIDDVKLRVRKGYTQYTSYSGRVIHLPADLPHKAPNYIVQGTARELLVDALLAWDKGPYTGGVVVPVHDEILAEIPESQATQALQYLQGVMTTQFQGVAIEAEAWDTPRHCWSK